jgi:hypothetical protein
MYLGTGDIIATIIALSSALIVLGLAIKDNARLSKENKDLRRINKAYRSQVNLHV